MLQFQGLLQGTAARKETQVPGRQPPGSAQILSTAVRLQAWGPQGRTSPWHQVPHTLLSTSSSAQKSHPASCAPGTCSCIQQGLAQYGPEHWDTRHGGSRERVRGTAGTGRMWPVPHSHQTAPGHTEPCPAPGRFPAPWHSRESPQVGDPHCLCLTSAPTMAGAMEPFHGVHGHSSPLDGQILLTALGWHL